MNLYKFKKGRPSSGLFSIQEGVHGKLGSSYKFDWAQESFFGRAEIKDVIGKNFDYKRLAWFYAGMLILFMLIFGRTAWLQVVKGSYYYSMAEGNRIRIERLEARRGVIYDRKGRALVRNTANFMLYFVPADLPAQKDQRSALIARVCAIIGGLDPKIVGEELGKIKEHSIESFQPFFVTDNIAYEKAMLLLVESENWSGVVISNKTKREYSLYSRSLSHILGYTGKISEEQLKELGSDYSPIDYAGKMGIEYFWENELHGINGQKEIEVDALGKEKKLISEKKGVDGRNLVLALDITYQKKLEELMLAEMGKRKLKRGSAILLDPRNGELLAMVSLPAYDNNLFARGISSQDYKKLLDDKDKPLFNRIVSGEFPSGSTIKPVVSAAALEDGIITQNTTVHSAGGIRIGQWFFPDWKAGGHGIVNVKGAIANSVNTFYYYIGGGYEDFKGLGLEKMTAYMRLFGLGEQTGIDLPGESNGFLPSAEWKEKTKKESWYIGDTYHLAIGQGDLLVTPLQVAMYTGFFANGGKLYRPHIVTTILDSSDKVVEHVAPEALRPNFIQDSHIAVVKEGMRLTASVGSARSLQSVRVPAAGKTGTAQWSTRKANHAWFTGFAPYDKPELAITILVEEGGEGSDTAVPIARQFFEWKYGSKVKSTSTPEN